jgi:carbon storage regulator CsrA
LPSSAADTPEAEALRRLRPLANAKETQAMLILTRKVDQGIVISGNILVRVLGVERDRVKIGISAPGEVTVLRQELWSEENANAPFEKKPQTNGEGGSGPAAASA